jgi:hypothetical protein
MDEARSAGRRAPSTEAATPSSTAVATVDRFKSHHRLGAQDYRPDSREWAQDIHEKRGSVRATAALPLCCYLLPSGRLNPSVVHQACLGTALAAVARRPFDPRR